MRLEFVLPSLGTENEAKVSLWHIEEEEEFVEEEDSMEVATNKETFNIPAPHSGRLIARLVYEGDIVKVGDVIGVYET